MKRILPCILMAALILSACAFPGERFREPVTFYYLRANPEQLRPGEELFVGEIREAAGHSHDLSYLMALYLIGPSEEELASPLPRGVRITSAAIEADSVLLELSEPVKPMSDIDYALACTCLSMTCLELTGAQSVTITCGERSVTMNRQSLVLEDNTATNPTEEAS